MGLQPWQEAKLILSDQNLGLSYFQFKTEALKKRLEIQKLKTNIHTIPTRDLNRMWERARSYYNYASFRHTDYLVAQKYPWYKEFVIDPIEDQINTLKAELDLRPPLSPKLNRKQMRQCGGKKNRSYGRCKNR